MINHTVALDYSRLITNNHKQKSHPKIKMISLINRTVAFDYLQLILNNHNRSCLIVIVFYFLCKNQVDINH